ncbi:MAG: redoxin domain-containing protein [Planctomycetes bacterium]|nr:redoxin domain-containing protein [Planctomycetota bacterium]
MGFQVLVALAGSALVLIGTQLFMPTAPNLPVISGGDVPKLIVMALGAGWTLLGTVQGIRIGRSRLGKAFLVLNLLLTLGVGGAATWWVVDYSYRLPAAAEIPAQQTVPDFELTNQKGESISAKSLRGKPFVLIFSRGVW